MKIGFSSLRTLLFELPRYGKLTYCLARDDRVPLGPKLALGAVLGLIVSPVDVPAWVPVVGDLDLVAMGALAVKVFVDACPEGVVEEHRAAMKQGASTFDRDLGRVLERAREVGGHLLGRLGASLPAGVIEDSEERSR
jgi:uncharacterized membrane protein YkvA (DUF1232 family)